MPCMETRRSRQYWLGLCNTSQRKEKKKKSVSWKSQGSFLRMRDNDGVGEGREGTHNRRLERWGCRRTHDYLGKAWKRQDLVEIAHWDKAKTGVVRRAKTWKGWSLRKVDGSLLTMVLLPLKPETACSSWISPCCCRHRAVISHTDSGARAQQIGVTHVYNSRERWKGCVSRIPIMLLFFSCYIFTNQL